MVIARSLTVPHFVFFTLLTFNFAASDALAGAQDPVREPAAAAAGKPGPGEPVSVDRISEGARAQIRALAADKAARTPAQRKISSRLLYASKARRGLRLAANVPALRGARVAEDKDGRVDVEIGAVDSKAVAEAIEKAGGTIVYGGARATTPGAPGARGGVGVTSVRARVPIDALEELAALDEVRAIKPSAHAITQSQLRARTIAAHRDGVTPEARAANVRERLRAALERIGAAAPATQQSSVPPQLFAAGAATTAGDVAHRAAEARNYFGVTGAGAKIGVLSDSVDFLAQSIATGDLPPDVVVLPGQSGEPGSGEGTAMLELIHDLAPGAKLYFATAFTSVESFADNIRALRAAGCDIIVDDVIYDSESPFQDGPIAAAVNDVTADGAVYFSSAGNQGNFNDGTSSVWEGDYKLSTATIGALAGAGDLHDFGGGVISNRAESTSQFILGLYWSDPLGAASNDYDFYILNNTLTTIIDAGTDVQDGDDDPFESVFPGAFGNERVVIVKYAGEPRALHLNNYGGQFGIATAGQTHGHNSAAAAFGVAAVDVATASGGVFTGGPTNPVELFSSDGNRRVFFAADGTPYKPGNLLFRTNGGQVRNKPDITGADGGQTTVPGFQPFFGTSAAAPHVAAIAGLLKSAKPNIKPNKVRQALQQSALDIEAPGRDRDSGHGLVDAFGALLFIGAPPAPFLDLGEITATAVGGDGDPYIEPGESGRILAQLVNVGGATALTVKGTLATSTPGVTITTASSNYPNIGSNGQAATNLTPYAFNLAAGAVCGLAPDFALTATYSNGANSPQVFTFRVPTGQPGSTPQSTSYAGAPVAIPDSNAAGVDVPLTVSAPGAIANIAFSIDGASCTSTQGATTVGLDHSWVGDLKITLTSPQGTVVTLADRPGGTLNGGNNLCGTVFDDAAANSIQAITSAGAPYTGTFKPASPLSVLKGEDPNGVWTLHVTDGAASDTGSVRAFTLSITTYQCGAPALTTQLPVTEPAPYTRPDMR